MAKRCVMPIQEPLDIRNAYEVADRLAALGDVLGVKVDEIADVAYIVMDTAASDYALRGVAPGWQLHPCGATLTRRAAK